MQVWLVLELTSSLNRLLFRVEDVDFGIVYEKKFDDVFFKICSGNTLAALAGGFYTCVV